MKTNIYAPFWIIKAALPHLKARLCHHRELRPNRPTTPRPIFTITRRPRPRL